MASKKLSPSHFFLQSNQDCPDHERKDGGGGDNVDRRVIERSTLFMQFTDIMTGTPSLLPFSTKSGLLLLPMYSINRIKRTSASCQPQPCIKMDKASEVNQRFPYPTLGALGCGHCKCNYQMARHTSMRVEVLYSDIVINTSPHLRRED